MRIAAIALRTLCLPLIRPYRLSYRTFTEFEPIVVEMRSADGKIAWGEGHISPGSSGETREGGWAFCREHAATIVGMDTGAAKAELAAHRSDSKVAATALLSAIEMLEGHRLLDVAQDAHLPLVTPFSAEAEPAISEEVERRLADGFRTFKIKVGKDWRADLAYVCAIQTAIAGRATMRIDANRAYGKDDACQFACAVDPASIELFEQPCAAEDWEANAAVAKVSAVPLMLDEPICALADVDRAAAMKGVGFLKLKLKRFGGLDLLYDALLRVRHRGMEPVLGDGLSSEICCWMEACVARTTIRNAGEFNGFLKPTSRLFANPLTFREGALMLPKGYVPEMDHDALAAHTVATERFAAHAVRTGGA
jgi:L-Ala-D/L-Glu epimerase / N-acetyl-D-glutamate racemase